MKNFLKSVGKASIYFLVYFATQLVMGFVYGIMFSVNVMTSGEATDAVEVAEQLNTFIMDKAMEMTFWAGVMTLVIFWIRFAVRKKNFLKEIECKKIAKNSILPIVVIALGMNVVLSVVIGYFPWPQGWMEAYMENSSIIDGSLMSWLAAVVMAPLLEEIVFRGLVYTRLKKGMPAIAAAIVASLAFGLCHSGIIWMIYATALGLVMTWIFEKYQSLLANILFHLAFNLMGQIISMIPENMAFVVWILAAAGVVGIVYGVKQIKNITVVEESVVEQIEEACEA